MRASQHIVFFLAAQVCSFLVASDRAQSSGNEIREALESNDDSAKIAALQQAITMLLSGEQLPTLFITIVRYVLPSENHMVQKLLLLYLVSVNIPWEADHTLLVLLVLVSASASSYCPPHVLCRKP